MRLLDAIEDQYYTLEAIGGDEHFARRASSMGLVPDTEMRIVRSQKKMPILVFARDTLIAINRKDAAGIEVKQNG